jgi:hypothetical protein
MARFHWEKKSLKALLKTDQTPTTHCCHCPLNRRDASKMAQKSNGISY